ncbi:MAG: alpha/beta hydrolase [Chloroflexi bacterium]|nr:alpha/beta hydrolase [Chloroflexota bacterium]
MNYLSLAISNSLTLGTWCLVCINVYFSQKKQDLEVDTAKSSLIAETKRGPIEYITIGEGPPVLFVHGGLGGFDQGLVYSQGMGDYKFIVPSRPGFLRTPLTIGCSPKEQADVLAAFLDTLNVSKAAVFGMSAGGPIALQFAIRHPERCCALVLLSALNQPRSSIPIPIFLVKKLLLLADPSIWVMNRIPLLKLFGWLRLLRNISGDQEKEAMLTRILQPAFSVKRRINGMVNDLTWLNKMESLPLESIYTPTLVIHGHADTLVPFSQGRISEQSIPGAEMLSIAGGDHICYITHLEETRPTLRKFLASHAP